MVPCQLLSLTVQELSAIDGADALDLSQGRPIDAELGESIGGNRLTLFLGDVYGTSFPSSAELN